MIVVSWLSSTTFLVVAIPISSSQPVKNSATGWALTLSERTMYLKLSGWPPPGISRTPSPSVSS